MKQLDPKAIWLFFVSLVLRWFILIMFLSIWAIAFFSGFFNESSSDTTNSSPTIISWLWIIKQLWIIIPVFLIVCFIWAKLTYRFYYYELTDIGFRKELGVIYKKYVTIPYGRIQSVEINRGILSRIFGLSDLYIQTAGINAGFGSHAMFGSEGLLPGLSRKIADQLRQELIQRAHQSKNQGL